MTNPRRTLSWCGVAVLSACCATAVLAQSRNDVADGSLTALTAELRQLRTAVEQLARSQTQTQALGVYLSVQQSRIVQVSSRLDAVHKDLDAAAVRSQDVEGQLATVADELSRVITEPQRRQLEDAVRSLKAEQRHLELELQQARSRESELSQVLQGEQSRWNDLISRLEQLLTK